MKPLTLEEIRAAVHGRWMARGQETSFTSVAIDTRTAQPGELFFAIRGEKMDGHDFLLQAAEAGCEAAVAALDADLPDDVREAFPGGVVGVADTTAALGELGAMNRRQLGATVVAVTGSNGKTTVKRLIHHVLSRRLKGTCSPKSFNNKIGVPLTLLGVSPGDDYVVCELGTNAPGEIAALARMTRPDVAVITSLGPAHLERLGGIERIAAEKASILGSLAEDGLAVIFGDSDLLLRAAKAYRRRVIRFGLSDEAELRLTGRERLGRSQRFHLNDHLWVALPLPGEHNALNALAAIAVAQRFGFERADAAAALADFAGEAMRLQWQDVPGGTIVNDAYNANPASLAAAAAVLAGCEGPRRVLIAGDMKELGDRAEQIHRQVGRELGDRGIELVITVGPLARRLAEGADEAGLETASFETCQALQPELPRLLREGDAVLVKGSRAMAMEQLIGPIRAALASPEGDGS